MRQYSPEALTGVWVTPLLGAVDVLQSYADGEFVTTTKLAKRWAHSQSGRNGVRVKNVNRGGSISVTYPADAQINQILAQIAEADDITENQVGPLQFKDPNGGTVVLANNAYLDGEPDFRRGTGAGTLTWTWWSDEIRESHAAAALIGV